MAEVPPRRLVHRKDWGWQTLFSLVLNDCLTLLESEYPIHEILKTSYLQLTHIYMVQSCPKLFYHFLTEIIWLKNPRNKINQHSSFIFTYSKNSPVWPKLDIFILFRSILALSLANLWVLSVLHHRCSTFNNGGPISNDDSNKLGNIQTDQMYLFQSHFTDSEKNYSRFVSHW